LKYFGTDGIRGIVNSELTTELAYKVGLSLASFFGENKVCVIGRDTRVSGGMLVSAIATGLSEGGVKVIEIGFVTSPALCFITKNNNFDFGIMVTASHNPPEYNGIKIFDSNGVKLSECVENQIERLIDFNNVKPNKLKFGEIIYKPKYVKDYVNYLVESFKHLKNCQHKICLDCSNGASTDIVRKVVKNLNLNATIVNTSKNGMLVNKNCGAAHIEFLKEFSKNKNFDACFSFDGDADRIIMLDNFNEVRDGDDILFALSKAYKKQGKLKGEIVATDFSNFGLDASLKKLNINVTRVLPGDSKVFEKLVDKNLLIGGERTGHIIIADHVPCGDGVFVMLTMLSLMQSENKTISEICGKLNKYKLVEINVPATKEQKIKLFENFDFKKFLFSCDEIVVKDGRILVRPSGTENLVRILVENENIEKAKKIATLICDYIKNFLLSAF